VVQVIEYLPSNCNFKFQYHQKKRGGGWKERKEGGESRNNGKGKGERES
jgi:hypothetical protein